MSIGTSFRFNSIVVNNTNGIYLSSINRSAISEKTNDGYAYRKIVCNVKIKDTDRARRKQKQRNLLQNLVNQKGRLVFSDDAHLFYDAEIVDEIQVEEDTIFTVLTITFTCDPVMHEFTNDLTELFVDELTMPLDQLNLVVNHHFWSNIVTSTTKQISNNGNYITKPIIEINGKAELITLQIADVAFSFNNLNGTIFVDCEKMIVYKIENTKKISLLSQFRGQFPIIPVGISDVLIGGKSFNISMTIDYKNTYIV